MKKLIKVIVAILLILNSSVSNVYADDTVYTEGDFNYTIDDEGSIKIILYFGSDETVEVPRFIGLHKTNNDEYVPRYVTVIGTKSFLNSDVKKVILPDTVAFIEEKAFKDDVVIEYRDSEGQAVDQENVHTIVIRPLDNSDTSSTSTSSSENSTPSIEFEEISNEYDTETGEEKDIWEITEENNNETAGTNENIATNDSTNESYNTPVTSTKYSFNIFGVIFVATAIFAIIYYSIQFKKKK